MKIALLCGGPSLERGISLNSARSILDHLEDDNLEIVPVYFDQKRAAYKISKSQLYSNTPSDFDFKLKQAAVPLSESDLIKLLKAVDITFPVMHGPFGEDGEIQSWLEKHGLPFVGSSSAACKKAFDKQTANEFIQAAGFFALPSVVLKIFHSDHEEVIRRFFAENSITRAVVKPAAGGSSIGVFSVSTVEEAVQKAELIFSKRMDTRVVVEPFAVGREFTVIILQNRFGLPVAVLPTEIEADYQKHQIFDFRKKYLPTRAVTYHCPPRFDDETIERIQVQAEQLFTALGMRDFARFDGWVLDDGNIWFADFNPISGMEQNSFLFQQSSRIGLSHQMVLRYILERAASRYHLTVPPPLSGLAGSDRRPVRVLFGGGTSERQVSLMSGTNVWLKLRKSTRYRPSPYLLAPDGDIWQLPYAYTLNHTVEEIVQNCERATDDMRRLERLVKRVHLNLGLADGEGEQYLQLPVRLTFAQFLSDQSFVFLALHGGDGENGAWQATLDERGIPYNGSGPDASALCMDKWETGRAIREARIPGVETVAKELWPVGELLKMDRQAVASLWIELCRSLRSRALIVKPRAEGCSSGIVRLSEVDDLATYLDLIASGVTHIPAGMFRNQPEMVEMGRADELLFEKFIATDTVRVKGNTLKHRRISGWVESTVGVLEENGVMRVLNPSITVAEGEVLSVEEKFQGGTGVNITPPPVSIISPRTLATVKQRIGRVAAAVGLAGYGRIDAFIHTETGKLLIIEINSLPGLTPSTVLYHQALAEKPAIFPIELLERIIANSEYL
ncbi:hypothetical protein KGQ71_02160 [Patescibacteria group bacterium]|nr:hypothetical protein [Patescibacteria group bacterium]